MGDSFIKKLFGKANASAETEPTSKVQPQSASAGTQADPLRPARYLRSNINREAIAELKMLFEEEAATEAPSEVAPSKGEPQIVALSEVTPSQIDVPKRIAQQSLRSPEEIGSFVREKRKAMRMSQKVLCEKANVGARFMVELEAGKHTLEIGKVLHVLAALGVGLTVH